MAASISLPQRALVAPPGRGGDVQDERGPLLHQLFDGIDVIEPILPEAFVVPRIFANRERGRLPIDVAKALPRGGREVALLVEHVVVGQQHLRLHKLHAPLTDQRGGIPHVLPCPRFSRGDVSGDHCDGIIRRGPRNLAQSLAAARNEGRFLQQIGRRIAADGQLRKQHQAGATLLCPPRKCEDFCGISAEIADGGIDLSERDLHSFSVATSKRLWSILVVCLP